MSNIRYLLIHPEKSPQGQIERAVYLAGKDGERFTLADLHLILTRDLYVAASPRGMRARLRPLLDRRAVREWSSTHYYIEPTLLK